MAGGRYDWVFGLCKQLGLPLPEGDGRTTRKAFELIQGRYGASTDELAAKIDQGKSVKEIASELSGKGTLAENKRLEEIERLKDKSADEIKQEILVKQSGAVESGSKRANANKKPCVQRGS